MKKLAGLVLAFLFALNIFFTPLTVFAQDPEPVEKVDVYSEFWPIVPGTTVADGTFFLKQLKETFGGILSFSNIAKSENQIGISEKRLVESYKLLENKDYGNMVKSLELNEKARNEAVSLKKKAIEANQDAKELTNKLVASLEKQQKALAFMQTLLPEDQKSKVQEYIEEFPLQISEAK